MTCAVAYPNIALIKYWGKRNKLLNLPMTSSLSMTLDIYPTTTTVLLAEHLTSDDVRISGVPAHHDFAKPIREFLDHVRDVADTRTYAIVDTRNTVPTGAGLASSAAGFAALATAASAAYRLDLNEQELSRLARRGSGSAARSIHGGYVEWHRGEGDGLVGDLSSYASPIDAHHLDMALVVVVVDSGEKPIPSRQAMNSTVATSPLYSAWAESSTQDLHEMRTAFELGDVRAVGAIAERNALGMHATMLAARPAIRYLTGRSLFVLDRIAALRASGIAAYATIDAGPNIKVLCRRDDAEPVATALAEEHEVSVHVAKPGPGAQLLTPAPAAP